MECPSSLVLPGAQIFSDDRARGSIIGAYVREIVGGAPKAPALARIPERWRATCDGLRWDQLVGDMVQVKGEIAYALNVETDECRTLGSNIGRAYPDFGYGWIYGTNDLEGVRIDDVQIVKDVKSGQPVTAAADNAQIGFEALARYRVTDVPEIEGQLAYVRASGYVKIDPATFTPFELESFADKLRALNKRVLSTADAYANGDGIEVSAGPWCRYCPGKIACPRYVSLARAMTETSIELHGGATEITRADVKRRLSLLQPAEQAAVWRKARDAASLLEDVIESMKEIARDMPIPLGDGKELAPVAFDQERLSQSRAVLKLRELLREKFDEAEVERQIDALHDTTDVEQVRELNIKTGAPRKRAPKKKELAT